MEALTVISRRIDLLLVLPIEKLGRLVLEAQMEAIGEASQPRRPAVVPMQ
jgi:hypothetical protein